MRVLSLTMDEWLLLALIALLVLGCAEALDWMNPNAPTLNLPTLIETSGIIG